MTTHDYSANDLGIQDVITVFNPHPYPVTISSKGYVLGGRETALVLRADPYVVRAVAIKDVIVIEPQIPASAKKNKKSSS